MFLSAASLIVLGLAGAVEPASLDLIADWRFAPDPEGTGEQAGWHAPEFDDAAWAVMSAGRSWETQGYPAVDGHAWYRRTADLPAEWEGRRVWFVIGAVNDACVVYCNGARVNAYGDATEITCADTPIIVDLTAFLRFGARNLIAVSVYDWGGNGGLWRAPCLLTTRAEDLPTAHYLAHAPDFKNSTLIFEIDLKILGMDDARKEVRAEHFRDGHKSGWIEHNNKEPRAWTTTPIVAGMGNIQPGEIARIELVARARDKDDALIAEIPGTITYTWPDEDPPARTNGKVLNNFVTELLDVAVGDAASTTLSFENPREGWVFFACNGGQDAPAPVTLDEEATPIVWRVNPETGASEAMRFLDAAAHRLRIENGAGARVIVRAIPEILFCYYPSTRHIEAYPEYDWAYMERHVLPHVNVLITRSDVPPEEFEQWLREGRRWIGNASLPGLGAADAPTADAVYEAWAANPAVTQPGFSGIMVDEFLYASEAHYAAWSEALRRLCDSPKFAGKTFYAWCTDIFRDRTGLDFLNLVAASGGKFSWEKYLSEEPSEQRARLDIQREITRALTQWRERQTDVNERLVVCLGYLSAPPETLNVNPGVDYHVFLDMQFHTLATDPTFEGLYGIMEYMAAYADEESLRFAHKLLRHYCIEGNRTRFSRDPYMLPHLKNGDFAYGFDDWEVHKAEETAIHSESFEGFSWLQGRYPRTRQGDHYCVMTRSAKGPNTVRQTLRELEPGRLYSVKLISADRDNLDARQTLGIAITVEGSESLDEYGFQYAYPSCYSHELGPYNSANPAWFNFHRIVFRAHGETAMLSITDWPEGAPGGSVGHKTAFNFVEVQPFWTP
ncbi:MAG TPA: hypothetical protein PKI11_01780 [Candidatus Hydrogenedentes bacterium]|nr:hypothetical protein [Candidatus Hydrogenedentota bacterium]HNT87310.1 hypothetical protein [Candidatus Hydrogenedentota bacterium]